MKVSKRQLKRIIWEAIKPGDGQLNDEEAKLLQGLSNDAAAEEPMEEDEPTEEEFSFDDEITEVIPKQQKPEVLNFLKRLDDIRQSLVRPLQAITRSASGKPQGGTRNEMLLYVLTKEIPSLFNKISKNQIQDGPQQVKKTVMKIHGLVSSRKIDNFKQGLMHLSKMLTR